MRRGFTMIELLVVVALIGILSALAISSFSKMQYRAKMSELTSNVAGIRVAEDAYRAAYEQYISESTFRPDSTPGKAPRAWVSGTAFDDLGWKPPGQVRGSYKVSTTSATAFVVTGITDVNGDGQRATYTATRSVNALITDEF